MYFFKQLVHNFSVIYKLNLLIWKNWRFTNVKRKKNILGIREDCSTTTIFFFWKLVFIRVNLNSISVLCTSGFGNILMLFPKKSFCNLNKKFIVSRFLNKNAYYWNFFCGKLKITKYHTFLNWNTTAVRWTSFEKLFEHISKFFYGRYFFVCQFSLHFCF